MSINYYCNRSLYVCLQTIFVIEAYMYVYKLLL